MKKKNYIWPMARIDNFLQQSVEQVRQSIIDIDDSYNNEWDILAELIQNAVDAIRKSGRQDGQITISFNAQDKSIKVTDNGCGIEPSSLPKLLSMFGTDKKGDEATIGEKGVGLKFAIFSCNDFYIKSGTASGTSEALVKDAYNWKNRSDDDFLSLEHNDLTETETSQGTQVRLEKLPADLPIFQLTDNQLIYIIRTRTAIGNTLTIWDNNDINIQVEFNYLSQDGLSSLSVVPFRYWLPTETTTENERLNLQDYYSYLEGRDRTDQDKRNKLKNKIIFKTKTFDHKGRTIKSFACFVPKRSVWDNISISSELATEENLEDNLWLQEFNYAIFKSGIFTSVKGMPTGISMEHPITGQQGYWPNIFILFEDRHLKFDIGRKSIHGRQANIYREFARDIFVEYQRLSKYIAGDVSPESPWEKDEIFKEIETLIDLNSTKTTFKKTPRSQEGTVAGMFFEAIGNGNIKNITPLVAGYKNKYDLYAHWGNKNVVIEFKSQLYKILKDFSDETKLFNEVNCIVCWDVSEEDQQAFSDVGVQLEKIPPKSSILPNQETFPHATHTLRYSGLASPVYVIDLKTLLGI